MNPATELILTLLRLAQPQSFLDGVGSLGDDGQDFAGLLETLVLSKTLETQEDTPQPVENKRAVSNQYIQSLIDNAALKYGVNPELISEVVRAESGFNPGAISPAGAEGLMQLMPATAAGYGVTDPMDAAQNVDAGTHFLSDLLRRYGGDVPLALAAYNAGPGAVEKYHGIPPYKETRAYVHKIAAKLDGLNKTV